MSWFCATFSIDTLRGGSTSGTSWPTTVSCRRFRSVMYPNSERPQSVESRAVPSCIMYLSAAKPWTRLLTRHGPALFSPNGQPLLEASGLLDLQTLREEVGHVVNDRLKEVLEAEREATLEKVERHIRTKQPEYSRLLKQKRYELGRIKWTDNSKVNDATLYRVKQDWEFEILEQQSAVEQKLIESETEVDKVAQELYEVVSATNLAGQDDLVRYVLKRRAVLHLLRKLISRGEERWRSTFTGSSFPSRRPIRSSTTKTTISGSSTIPCRSTNSSVRTFHFQRLLLRATAWSDRTSWPLRRADPYQHISIVELKKPDRRDNTNPRLSAGSLCAPSQRRRIRKCQQHHFAGYRHERPHRRVRNRHA